MSKLKPTEKVMQRFKGASNKPRLMKKILGINDDGSTADYYDDSSAMVDEDDEVTLQKRSKSRLRSISRNRSVSTKRELTEMEKVSETPLTLIKGSQKIEKTLRQGLDVQGKSCPR